jgi:hypothetical protein
MEEAEEEPKPNRTWKRIITAPWRYKENGKYITYLKFFILMLEWIIKIR